MKILSMAQLILPYHRWNEERRQLDEERGQL